MVRVVLAAALAACSARPARIVADGGVDAARDAAATRRPCEPEVVATLEGNALWSLAVDRAGGLRLAYKRFGELTLATRGSRGWSFDPVHLNGWLKPAVAIAAADSVQVVYSDNTGTHRLRLPPRSTDTVTSDEVLSPSLAIGESGAAHVAYVTFVDGRQALAYATAAGGAWATEIVDPGPVGVEPAIAVARDGTVHIAARDPVAGRILHFVRSGGGWTSETAAFAFAADGPALALDANDRPWIAFSDDRGVHVATADSPWRWETIDTRGGTGVALASHGEAVHVSWRSGDRRDDALRYARRDANGAWRVRTLERSPSATGETTLAVDGTGTAHIVYDRIADDPGLGSSLVHVALAPDCADPCDGVVCGAGGGPCMPPPACVDGACVQRAPEPGACGECAGPRWDREIVDPDGGWHAAAAADAAGGLYVVSQSADRQRLRFAERPPGGEWRVETIDARVGTDVSPDGTGFGPIAVDALGDVHVAYIEHGEGDGTTVRYAVRGSDRVWQTAVVDESSVIPGWETALALEPDGVVDVVYPAGLELARARGGLAGFSIDIIPGGTVHHAIAIDASGNLRVAFEDDHGFYYWAGGDDWHVESIPVGSIGTGPETRVTMALDSRGVPSVVVPVLGSAAEVTRGDDGSWTELDFGVPPLKRAGAITIGADGVHHVAIDAITSVRVASRTIGTDWSIEGTAEPTEAADQVAIALDAGGAVHVFHQRDGLVHLTESPCE